MAAHRVARTGRGLMADTSSPPERRAEQVERRLETSSADRVRLRHRSSGNQDWIEAVDSAGRRLATVEGKYDSNGDLLVTRAVADRSEPGKQAVSEYQRHFEDQGIAVTTAPTSAQLGETSAFQDISEQLIRSRDDARDHFGDTQASRIEAAERRWERRSAVRADRQSTVEADQRLEQAVEGAGSPHQWIKEVNPGYDQDRRRWELGQPVDRLNRIHNCVDAAMAVQDTHDRLPRAAAAGTAEPASRISEWAGFDPETNQSYADIERRLASPGDSAVVAATYMDGGGHAFNAVNISGRVCYVDGQAGTITDWPPPFAPDTSSVAVWYLPGGTGGAE